jgi:hypothetical protein
LRQANGRPQCRQNFSGRSDLLTDFPLRRMALGSGRERGLHAIPEPGAA